jgi:phosphoribosyl 1,2-cyclic phosphate phosphodiesterase
LLETNQDKTILIDASPDLRAQLLQLKTTKLDAVIITHDHADHTHGVDDLRPFSLKKSVPLPVYTDLYSLDSLTIKFPYIFQREKVFENKAVLGGGIPLLDLHPLLPGPNLVADEMFQIYALPHGHGESLAFIHKKFGYIIDCREIPDAVVDNFRDAKLEVLIIDCVRYEPHETHLHVDLALEYIQKISPRIAILTHMGHELDYLDLTKKLQRQGIRNVFPGIDGQSYLYS